MICGAARIPPCAQRHELDTYTRTVCQNHTTPGENACEGFVIPTQARYRINERESQTLLVRDGRRAGGR
eukprot:99526-Prymnesium_polylepis.1